MNNMVCQVVAQPPVPEVCQAIPPPGPIPFA
jgi:hypothetical protein